MKSLVPLCALLLSACSPRPLYVHENGVRQYTVSSGPADTALLQLLHPYKRGVDTQMLAIIGHTDIPLTKAQPESTLGNFMADATLAAGRRIDPRVVAAVGNYGGLRIPYIAPGPITRGKLYELMPFDNMLCIVEIPGVILQQFCDSMAWRRGWPVSGLSFTIRNWAATDIKVAGAALNPSLVYKIAVNDYISRGGDNCDFLAPLRKRHTTVALRDAMMDYVSRLEAEGKPLHPELQNRIQYAE